MLKGRKAFRGATLISPRNMRGTHRLCSFARLVKRPVLNLPNDIDYPMVTEEAPVIRRGMPSFH